jgi:hypothetical protein
MQTLSPIGLFPPIAIGAGITRRTAASATLSLPVAFMLLRAVLSMPDVGQLDAFAEPWRRLYAHSPLVSTLILFGHLGGLFAAGGLTVAADRATLRLDPTDARDRARHLADLARLQAPVSVACGVALWCGALLFLADVEAFAMSPIFWSKMVLVALLVANAIVSQRLDAQLRRADASPRTDAGADPRRWRRRRLGAGASAALWFVLVLAGTALASH